MSQTMVNVDIVSLSKEVLKKIDDCYQFCYPENLFKPERAKGQIAQIGEYGTIMTNIISLSQEKTPITLLINHFFSLVVHYKNIAFPEGKYDANNSHLVLSTHGSVSNIYKTFDNTVMKASLNKKLLSPIIQVDLKKLFNAIPIFNSYNVAYPDGYYAKENCHPSMQMLQADNFMLSVLSYLPIVSYENELLLQPLNELQHNVNQLVALVLKAYPDNNLDYNNGHTYLSHYISHYKNTVTTFNSQLDTLASLPNQQKQETPSSTEKDAFDAINNLIKQNDKSTLRRNLL